MARAAGGHTAVARCVPRRRPRLERLLSLRALFPRKCYFHMVWKWRVDGNTPAPPSGRVLEAALVLRLADVLRVRLPPRWQARSRERVQRGPVEVDGIIDIVAPDGRDARLLLEVKARIEPKDV